MTTAQVDLPGGVRLTIETPEDRPAVTNGDAAMQVVKSVDERRYTLGLAYPAMRPDVARAQDGHRDFMAAEALETTAWSFMAKSCTVGLAHRDGTEGHGLVVESYIWRGDPWTVANGDGTTTVIKAGDWLVGTVWDEPTWADIKKGRWNGYSPQGAGLRATPTADRLAQVRR
ncbi:MAG: XkdF-like putative serine protease domain-containing protein [Solirubrobacteraceae bacterium]